MIQRNRLMEQGVLSWRWTNSTNTLVAREQLIFICAVQFAWHFNFRCYFWSTALKEARVKRPFLTIFLSKENENQLLLEAYSNVSLLRGYTVTSTSSWRFIRLPNNNFYESIGPICIIDNFMAALTWWIFLTIERSMTDREFPRIESVLQITLTLTPLLCHAGRYSLHTKWSRVNVHKKQ